MVDVDPIRRRRVHLVSIEPGVGMRDDRPRLRKLGGFACKITGFEFLKGCVDVVEVEGDDRRDLLAGVDLDDAEYFAVESVRPLVESGESGMSQDEVLPTGCTDCRRYRLDTDINNGPHVGDDGIPSVP